MVIRLYIPELPFPRGRTPRPARMLYASRFVGWGARFLLRKPNRGKAIIWTYVEWVRSGSTFQVPCRRCFFFTFKGWGFSGCTFFATCNLQVKISVVENALNITTCNCLEARYYWNIRVKYLWRGYPSVSRGLGIPASADGVSSPPTFTSDAPVYAPLKPKPNLHSGAIALPEPESEDAFSVVKPTIFPK